MADRVILDEQRLVKSSERVRDLGEVFTPAATVQAMLNLLPEEVWKPHPSHTFFEPAAGDGNFLVAILDRKLDRIAREFKAGTLPAGEGLEAVGFHGLEALASVYAVDISRDNVIGGTPGHEVGARQRVTNMFCDWYEALADAKLNARSIVRTNACWIVDRNLLVGNMLPLDADGAPSGRKRLPSVEYRWRPRERAVTVYRTTLGAVMDEAEADRTGVQSLFVDEPQPVWSGPATEIRKAPYSETADTEWTHWEWKRGGPSAVLRPTTRHPDILEVIADLSNDEVFTPPGIANAVLDLLPEQIWSNPELRLLDPGTKTGVFLREATKRLLDGLEGIIPVEQDRLDHILRNQVFGIGITELTSLMAGWRL